MTHPDEAPDSQTYDVMTATSAEVGEILVGRYRLEEHINDDPSGRQVWRGKDVVLRRPVAVVLRYPGGERATEMISAAIAASRITHPHLVDVYDAIDEERRAYVVREWVGGLSLRELVGEVPLDSVRATSVAHAVASAIAAAHAAGMAHGNVHPGSVLIADDGRVVLGDARVDEFATPERDVRAIGAVLYCALTGHWPHAEAGPDSLPDVARDESRMPLSPNRMRSGLPPYLCQLATDLLNPNVPAPDAESLALEFGRLDTDDSDDLFGETGALGFAPVETGPTSRSRRRNGLKVTVGVVALLAVAAAALVVATNLGGGNPKASSSGIASPAPTSTARHPAQATPLTISSVRVVDPKGNGTELSGAGKMIDGDTSTGWQTDWYNAANFGGGGYKPGMGVLIDLGKEVDVTNVKVDFDQPGATLDARIGDVDPGSGHEGDTTVLASYTKVGSTMIESAASSVVLPIGAKTRYILIWITRLPQIVTGKDAGKYQVGIEEITVSGR